MKTYAETLHCSFCGKDQREIMKLIAGPTVFICNECVGLCMGILKTECEDAWKQTRTEYLSYIGEFEEMTDYKTDEVFWDILLESEIAQLNADALVKSEGDLSAAQIERMRNYRKDQINFGRKAWAHFRELNNIPSSEQLNLIASRIERKVFKTSS